MQHAGEVPEGSVMRYLLAVAAVVTAVMVLPAVAAADAPICHNGILSDDAGQGCTDGLYAQVYGSGSSGSSSSNDICYDGILSDDAGQGCADGLYEQVYGSGHTSVSTGTSSPSYSGGGGSNSTMERIAQCESGGNPSTNTGNGFYGKYQFTDQTWHAMGGSGHASDASEAEQDMRAAALYDNGAGAGNWPVCSRR